MLPNLIGLDFLASLLLRGDSFSSRKKNGRNENICLNRDFSSSVKIKYLWCESAQSINNSFI